MRPIKIRYTCEKCINDTFYIDTVDDRYEITTCVKCRHEKEEDIWGG